MIDKKFFTNTYITGSGRQNYLKIDNLEDPLFTSFTFDIDYISSPLFYTINNSDYGYSENVEGIADSIEIALNDMYSSMSQRDQGYDILSVYSANILNDNKLGFGLQQNVYMDMPLYGATEYIYMVDKRNGSSTQNDVKYDVYSSISSEGNALASNSFKLGDSVNSIVSESDAMYFEEKKRQLEEQIDECEDILNDPNYKKSHEANKKEMDDLQRKYNDANTSVDGVEGTFGEEELKVKVDEYKNKSDSIEQIKKDIINWLNGEILSAQNKITELYNGNECIKRINKDSLKLLFNTALFSNNNYYEELKKIYTERFVYDKIIGNSGSYIVESRNIFNNLITFTDSTKDQFKTAVTNNSKSILLDEESGDGRINVRTDLIVNKFNDRLKSFGLLNDNGILKGKVYAVKTKSIPDWLKQLSDDFIDVVKSFISIAKKDSNSGYKDIDSVDSICEDWYKMSETLMSLNCDIEASFVDFESDEIKENKEMGKKYEAALDKVKGEKYGYENGYACDKNNATEDSIYMKYIRAKEKYENDDFSQAEKAKEMAMSGMSVYANIFKTEANNTSIGDSGLDVYGGITSTNNQLNRSNKSFVVPQTVLDMLGFIKGMKSMTNEYPYIIQGITGLDVAYNKHYGIKDPYMGSGDDKITITCLESLDLRVSSMFNRYFNAVYDRQYRRERVPVNLRRFNCFIYVHDVRNFVANRRDVYENRILELTDMYHSVIEFRFYDCEIIPEETGNIFNDISNEAPSEMKKTNFTFSYGNCVVNFVPQSEVVGK